MQTTIESYNQTRDYVNSKRDIIEKQLTDYSENWLKEHYPDVTLKHIVKLNGRLSRVLGRVKGYQAFNGSIGITSIELATNLLVDYHITGDLERVTDVLHHELVHYALMSLGLPHRDSDTYFQNECRRLGVGLTGETRHNVAIRHNYVCEEGHEIRRTRKFNPDNYRCGCGGRLRYEGKSVR